MTPLASISSIYFIALYSPEHFAAFRNTRRLISHGYSPIPLLLNVSQYFARSKIDSLCRAGAIKRREKALRKCFRALFEGTLGSNVRYDYSMNSACCDVTPTTRSATNHIICVIHVIVRYCYNCEILFSDFCPPGFLPFLIKHIHTHTHTHTHTFTHSHK